MLQPELEEFVPEQKGRNDFTCLLPLNSLFEDHSPQLYSSIMICWWKCRMLVSSNAQVRKSIWKISQNAFRALFSVVWEVKVEMFGKAAAAPSVAQTSKRGLCQRCCTGFSCSAAPTYSSFPLHLISYASLFCHGNSLMSCCISGLAFGFSSVTPLAPDLLSPYRALQIHRAQPCNTALCFPKRCHCWGLCRCWGVSTPHGWWKGCSMGAARSRC